MRTSRRRARGGHRVAGLAEQGGFDRTSVMDHVWQTGPVGPTQNDVLEACTTLGLLTARTERLELLTVVTAVTHRDPGLPAKAVTTLDVLSGGRAMLGIGAAWNEEESRGPGLFLPAHRPELATSLQVLREHCEHEGRDHDDIDKAVQTRFDLGPAWTSPTAR